MAAVTVSLTVFLNSQYHRAGPRSWSSLSQLFKSYSRAWDQYVGTESSFTDPCHHLHCNLTSDSKWSQKQLLPSWRPAALILSAEIPVRRNVHHITHAKERSNMISSGNYTCGGSLRKDGDFSRIPATPGVTSPSLVGEQPGTRAYRDTTFQALGHDSSPGACLLRCPIES